MEHSARTRIEYSRPRSTSISDVSKLDAALSTLSQEKSKSREIYTQELNGVFLKRVPLVEANFDTNSTIASYQYQVENARLYDVLFIIAFSGENTKITPGSTNVTMKDHMTVEGRIGSGKTQTFCLVEGRDKTKDFSFSANITILPFNEDVKETNLQGVILYTTVTYTGITSNITFEALNTKEFDVEVELDIKGRIKERSDSIPFRKNVLVGQKSLLGIIRSEEEIETSWKWTALSQNTFNPQKKTFFQTSELKGVTLKQTLHSGDPSTVEFEVTNSRDTKIRVEIDLAGDGLYDFKGQSRPLVGDVLPGRTTFIGTVAMKGDAEVNWKYKELS